MATKSKRTRATNAPIGSVKGGASAAKALTTGAGFDMAALHASPALVGSAGIVNGMASDEIDRRLIDAFKRSQS